MNRLFIKVSKQTGEIFEVEELKVRNFLVEYAKSFRHPNSSMFAATILNKIGKGERFETPAYQFFRDEKALNAFGLELNRKAGFWPR